MNKLQEMIQKYGVLVAAHRGMSCGNIPCNTIPAFEASLRGGARILEMDIFRSQDGKLYVFHTGQELVRLGIKCDVTKLTSSEIDKMPLKNSDGTSTKHTINLFTDVLQYLQGKDVVLNLDRANDILPEVLSCVREYGMIEQILLKTPPKMEYLKVIEAHAPDVMYMPIYRYEDTMTEQIEKMNINFVGLELVFKKESDAVAQPEYIAAMKDKGLILWGNGIVYNEAEPLAAYHSDDVSVYKNPDDGWGWLADHGFHIIQSDWAPLCFQYLQKKGYSR